MLILTINLDEQLRIGDDIIVTVRDINRAQVRLGIDAPAEVLVLREELITSPSPRSKGD